MTTVQDILDLIQTFAPLETAEEWDNVGLLVGRRDQEVKRVLVALDPFPAVIEEAEKTGAELILVHHPLMFDTKRVTEDDVLGRSIRRLVLADISEISLHTNLDRAQGGVNDCLAKAAGLEKIGFLEVDGVDCNGREYGYCRVGEVPEQDLDTYAAFVKKSLGCQAVRVVSGGKPVHRVAVGSGSSAKFALAAAKAGCDTYVTGDEKYSNFQEAVEIGLNVIDAGHFYTENVVCRALKERLNTAFPELDVEISRTHADMIRFL